MPLWKQRLFSRLHKPAGNDGADAGGAGASSEAATDTTADAGHSDAAVTGADEPADGGGAAEAPAGSDAAAAEGEQTTPFARVSAALDALTESPAVTEAAAAEAKKEGEAAATTEEATADAAGGATEAKPAEGELDELLEGVKSDRGRERVRKVFEENKQIKSDIDDFRKMVASTGMDAGQFAQTLEFGRLVNAGDEASLGQALAILENQRTAIYAALGKEAPGIDLLQGHADLKTAVENMEITRERAVELAKHRRVEKESRARQASADASRRDLEAFQGTVNKAAKTMEAYLETRKGEADHVVRMQALTTHFKTPGNMQKFVETYKPEQWGDTIRLMYDGVQVTAAPKPSAGIAPLRSRPTALGAAASNASASPIDRVAARMQSLNI